MSHDWIVIYSTNNDYQAELVKQMLLDEGMEAQIMDKSDSSFTNLGEYEVYVSQNDEEKAKALIKNIQSE
jgi:hypothetical protein